MALSIYSGRMVTRARAALVGFAALALAMGIGRFAFTPLLPLMEDDAGLSLADGGYLAAANYLGYLAGALWATRAARTARAIRASLLARSEEHTSELQS